VWAHSFTFSHTPRSVNVIPESHSQPTPCLGREPKAKVMTHKFFMSWMEPLGTMEEHLNKLGIMANKLMPLKQLSFDEMKIIVIL